MESDTQLYVGSLWHQNCDPFISVVATKASVCEKNLRWLADEEYQRMLDEAPEDEEGPEDDIMSGGVFVETVDTLHNIVCDGHAMEEVIQDLEEQGYFIC